MIREQWVITVLNVGAIALNAGCSRAPPPESIYPVSWYEAHNEERIARLQRCKENDGTEGGSPNCMNAQAAQHAGGAYAAVPPSVIDTRLPVLLPARVRLRPR